ncbi:MAG: acyltransferase [Nitrospira sp.]|nr:acyltransferase [Nitrospira sp.]MDH5725759.1 acyltransferase [Nitrospira sp.]
MGIRTPGVNWLVRIARKYRLCADTIQAELNISDPLVKYGFRSYGQGTKLGNGVEVIGVASRILLGQNVSIGDGVRLVCSDQTAEIIIGDGTVIQSRAILETGPGGRIELGKMNSVNPYCVLYGHGGLTTGDYVRIAAHTVIIPASHVFEDPDRPIARQGLTKQGIRIGRDVWIACGCRILDGVEIGDGSVIAAGAVVNRNVVPFAVVGGVPAKVIKMRRGK